MRRSASSLISGTENCRAPATRAERGDGAPLEPRREVSVARSTMDRRLLFFLLASAPVLCAAGEPPPSPLTLEQALRYALAHQPSLRAQSSLAEGAAGRVELARTGYLPEIDLSLELEAGSGNVLRGALFPTRGIPSVSGPPTARSLGDSAFGTLLGAGASWDAIGLAHKMALTDVALADEARARAGSDARRLEVAAAAADRFIDLVARGETVSAARASVERARVLDATVKALVGQDLRPGADASRADAELALAGTQLARAERAEEVSRAQLAYALGAAGQRIEVVAERLTELPRPALAPAAPLAHHPLLVEAAAGVNAARERRRATAYQYLPRLDVVAALWVRGSGLSSGALAPSPADGLAPDTPNWAAGLVLSWPVLELLAVRARARVDSANVHFNEAIRDEVAAAVQSQIDAARATLDGARRIARYTPVALAAARASFQQAMARYRAGLAPVVDVAEAQRLLSQAEIENAVASLEVRRATLLLARAVGDLEPFLSELRGDAAQR